MQIDIDETKYHISKEKGNHGCFSIIAKPRFRNCKYCAKRFESVKTEILFWEDNEGYRRSGWFVGNTFIW